MRPTFRGVTEIALWKKKITFTVKFMEFSGIYTAVVKLSLQRLDLLYRLCPYIITLVVTLMSFGRRSIIREKIKDSTG